MKKDFIKQIIAFLLVFLFPAFAWSVCTANDPTDPCTVAQASTAAQSDANCGNTYYLDSRLSLSGNIDFTASCTEGNELTVSCSDGTSEDLGGCEWPGGFSMNNADYVILKGMHFNNSSTRNYIYSGSTHNRITNNLWTQPTGNEATIEIGMAPGGALEGFADNMHNEFDHNIMVWTSCAGRYPIRINNCAACPSSGVYTTNSDWHFHHNVFDGFCAGGNYELLQTARGQSAADFQIDGSHIFEYNYIVDYDSDNSELISNKSSNNIYRYNTIINSDGPLAIRGGDNCEIYGNFIRFTGNQDGATFNGIRFSGDNHKVYNNWLEGDSNPSINPNNYMAIITYWGDGDVSPDSTNSLIANNTIRNTRSGFHVRAANNPNAPSGLTYVNNLAERNSNFTTGTYLFGGTDIPSSGTIWITNRGYITSGGFEHPNISSGVTNSGVYELIDGNRKTGLPVNWIPPSPYTNGTYNANVLIDIQGQQRGDPPDIGVDEDGGTDITVPVGCTWTGNYRVQVPVLTPIPVETKIEGVKIQSGN